MSHKGLNQLLCAALVNDRFRAELLADPSQAARKGYYGQKFALHPDELSLVSSIRVKGIEEFAAVIYRWIASQDGRVPVDTSGYEQSAQRYHMAPDVNSVQMKIFSTGNFTPQPVTSQRVTIPSHSATPW